MWNLSTQPDLVFELGFAQDSSPSVELNPTCALNMIFHLILDPEFERVILEGLSSHWSRCSIFASSAGTVGGVERSPGFGEVFGLGHH